MTRWLNNRSINVEVLQSGGGGGRWWLLYVQVKLGSNSVEGKELTKVGVGGLSNKVRFRNQWPFLLGPS